MMSPPPKILTLTLNPSLDRATRTARVQPTHKLRCSAPQLYAGGGGINVARVLHRFGAPVRALFPAGGANGQRVQHLLDQEGVPTQVLPVAGDTRDNLSVVDEATGQEYRLVMPGPTLSAEEWLACLHATVAACQSADWLVLSGSLPPGVPDDFYAQLHRAVQAAHPACQWVLDGSGPALAAALHEQAPGVALVKPSLRELGDLVGRPLNTPQEQISAAAHLVHSGRSEAVALSLGEDGALLVTAHGCWRLPALPVPVVSTTGAGDCLVAGMVWARHQGLGWTEAFRWGVACGAAAVMQPASALCEPDTVRRLLAQVPPPEALPHPA